MLTGDLQSLALEVRNVDLDVRKYLSEFRNNQIYQSRLFSFESLDHYRSCQLYIELLDPSNLDKSSTPTRRNPTKDSISGKPFKTFRMNTDFGPETKFRKLCLQIS